IKADISQDTQEQLVQDIPGAPTKVIHAVRIKGILAVPIKVIRAALIKVIHAVLIKVIRAALIKGIHAVLIRGIHAVPIKAIQAAGTSIILDREMNIPAEVSTARLAVDLTDRTLEVLISLKGTGHQATSISLALPQFQDQNKNQLEFLN
ncbi:hypothetical protein L0244_20575, partial [bacterium]|nr:hypothetical protein [bacterium]